MKPCSKTRSDKSACANKLSELPALYWNECHARSCYWSYIDFYTLITYNFMITDTHNSDTAAGAEFISSHRRCSLKFCKVRKKATVLASLFYKVASFQACNVTKKTPTQVFFCEIWKILKNTYSEEHLNDCFCALIFSSYIDFNSTRFSILRIKLFFMTQLKQ